MFGKFLIFCGVCVLWVSFSPNVTAEQQSSIVIFVADQSQEEISSSVTLAVRGQLSDLGVPFMVRWIDQLPSDISEQQQLAETISSDTTSAAVFWLFVEDELLCFYLKSSRGGMMFTRQISGLEQGVLGESVALILRSSIQSIFRDQSINDEAPEILESTDWQRIPLVSPDFQEQDEENASEREVEDDTPPEITDGGEEIPNETDGVVPFDVKRLRLGLGYAFEQRVATNGSIHGITLEADGRLFRGLHLFLSYTIDFPIETNSYGVTLGLRPHPFQLGLLYDHRIGRFGLGGRISISLDYVTEEVSADLPIVTVGEGGELEVALNIAFRGIVKLIGSLVFFVDIGLSAPFNRTDYAVATTTNREIIITTMKVRPVVVTGLSLGFF